MVFAQSDVLLMIHKWIVHLLEEAQTYGTIFGIISGSSQIAIIQLFIY